MWHEGSGNGWGTCIAGTMRHEIQAINNGIYHMTTVTPEQNMLSDNAT